jgi:peroxiredoxin
MKKRFIAGIVLVATCALYVLSAANALAQLGDSELPILKSLKVKDVEGKLFDLDQQHNCKLVVFLFLGTECPVSNGYCPEFRRIASEFTEKGVVFFGVHSDPSVDPEVAHRHAKEYELTFPILMDAEHELASPLGITVVPECVVLTPELKMIYRGRIDDRYSVSGKRRDEPRTHELKDAIIDGLAGRLPAVSEAKAFGCRLPKSRNVEETRR